MTSTIQNKQSNTEETLGKIIAGVVGVVGVAGVVLGATIALKDKRSREKVKKVFLHVKNM